jgi:periplasmic protein TonB
MVQVHAARHVFERPDATRVAALSGAMALNVAGLLVLLIPISMPTAPPRVEEPSIEIVFPPIVEPEPIKPVPTMPDAHVIKRPDRVAAQPVVEPVVEAPVFEEATVVEPWTPPPIEPTTGASVQPTGPVELGSTLRSLNATPPKYPRRALRAGIEGTVHLRILVGRNGVPLEVEVARGSGNRELDSEARRHVLNKWRFQPAMQDGIAVEAWGTVDIEFRLHSG